MPSRKKRRKKRKAVNRGTPAVQSVRRGGKNNSHHPTSQTSQAVPSNFAQEINRLITKGKIKAAVSRAKQYHKSLGTAKSERILIGAYVARIREMIAKGFIVEARALLEMIRERYHCPDHLTTELNGVIAVRDGRIDELVRPLDDPAIPPEKRTVIEKIIQNELVDLNLLAQSTVISAGHPLKAGAQAVAEAFAKVTSGFAQDAEIALHAISRRSPLAPWKMLIKALAAFYRHDDETCDKYLQTIDQESAPGRIVPLIRAMIAGKSNGNRGKKSSILVNKITGNSEMARDALRVLDNALIANKPPAVFKAVRNAMNICGQSCPELVERLKQHISVRSWMLGMDHADVNRALGGPSLKNAYFWRLQARAAEMEGKFLWACACWEEFRKHALYEGWFSEKSQAVAVIYLYMADLLKRLPSEDFEWLQSEFEDEFRGFKPYYLGQPKSILKAARNAKRHQSDTYFLYPERLYKLASKIDPDSEIFRQWLEWIENQDLHWKQTDAVAGAWHKAVPDDTRPLLYLMKSARQRNAFKKALGYLDKAERIDGLNPEVKRARLRLLAATTVRHLKQKKTRLARKDISQIEGLPQSGEGDRPAFVMALKFVCALIDGKQSRLDPLNRELAALLESQLAATLVIQGLLSDCGIADRQPNLAASDNDPLPGHDLVTACARGCQLGDDMGIAVAIPLEYEQPLRDYFMTDDGSHDSAAIRAIAETALRNDDFELAYAAAGAGLIRRNAATARFLLLRARSLPAWEMERKNDCITAAIELARRDRDMHLIDEAIELRRNGNNRPFGFAFLNKIIGEGNPSMDTEALNDVLELEKKVREYPSRSMPDGFYDNFDDDDYDDDDDESKCRYCDAENCAAREAPYKPDDLYDDDFDDDDDIDDLIDRDDLLENLLPGLPPDLMSVVMKVLAKHGRNGSFPDPEELSRKDPWLADELQRKIIEAMADGALPDFDQDWFPGQRPRKSKRY